LDDSTRFIAITVDGDGPYEIPIFPAESAPADLDALVTGLVSAIQGINPGEDRFSSFTVERVDADGTSSSGSGNYLRLTSGTADADMEHSSVQVFNASANSASRILKLGLSNGGREERQLPPCALAQQEPSAVTWPV
jgi:hypothetical protein